MTTGYYCAWSQSDVVRGVTEVIRELRQQGWNWWKIAHLYTPRSVPLALLVPWLNWLEKRAKFAKAEERE